MFEARPGLVNLGRPFAATLAQGLSRLARLGWRLTVPGVCGLCDGPAQWDRCRGGLDLCGHCEAALPALGMAGEEPPRLMADVPLLAPFDYRPPADFMVRQLKFAGQRSHARTLGVLLAEARLRWRSPLPDLLVPVPLHWQRLRERGFNQAHELARYAGRHLRIRVAARALRRVRPTLAQSGLPAAARAGNVQGCFAALPGVARGLRIALIDDVLTTGNTALEAVRCLQAAGAGEVEIWVACRAGRRG